MSKKRKKNTGSNPDDYLVDLLTGDYRKLMHIASESIPVFSGMEFPGEDYDEDLSGYRNLLESAVIGEIISQLIGNGNPRDALLALSEGSPLGRALPAAFRRWNQTVSSAELRQMYLDSLRRMHRQIEAEISRLTQNGYDSDPYSGEPVEPGCESRYEIESDDLPF